MIASAAPGAASSPTAAVAPSSAANSRPHHRVRGLSFLRRPRGNTPSPPVSPPERFTLEASAGYPLQLSNTASRDSAAAESRDAPAPTSPTAGPSSPNPANSKNTTVAPESSSSSSMARLRRAFSSQNGVSPQQQTTAANNTNTSSSSSAAAPLPPLPASSCASATAPQPDATTPGTGIPEMPATNRDGLAPDQMPTIKFIPHQDPRANKPSLAFAATSRTLPHEDCVIRVGRYSERDGIQNPPTGVPSAAPVGFKSKVVSRKHCEFWCSQGQWYIKDVKSSSGTFLNHIRLSQPNTESRPFPINDGDVVQLGIDFKGGEEAIFRCVKIRIECNRSWQKKLNDFNMNTHKRLLNKTTPGEVQGQSTECAICLMSIAPCQSLFVAPCSHVWHFKCIRPMLNDHKMYPQFMCPNCRAVTDLEADIEEVVEWNDEQEIEDLDGSVEQEEEEGAPAATTSGPQASGVSELPNRTMDTTNLAAGISAMELGDTSIDAALHSTTAPVEIAGSSARSSLGVGRAGGSLRPGTPGAEVELAGSEGPLTPRNDAGPFVFDGSARGATGRRTLGEQPQAATTVSQPPRPDAPVT